MFERFNALYLLQYTYYHPPISRTLFFFSISFLFLFYFLHLILPTSAVQFYLRYDLTADLRKSCARDLHFFTLLFPYFYFIFLMFERFYALCLLQYTTPLCIYPHPISRTYLLHPVHLRHLIPCTSCTLSCALTAPNPAYIRGLILPSVRSYRGFTQVLCPRSPLF
jgi:hypothetical protein